MVPSATNWSLAITNFQAAKAGTYQLVASNGLGSVVAGPAELLLNDQLHLDSFGNNLTNHCFQMRLVGIANTNYILQASTDLSAWVSIATNSSPTGLWTFTDTQSTNFLMRFYRAVPR